MKRAETLLKAAFALPTNLLVQAYNKREWPMFLRARGRYAGGGGRGAGCSSPTPIRWSRRPATSRSGFVMLAANRWADAASGVEHRAETAAQCARRRDRRQRAARAARRVQPAHRRSRAKGRATLEEVAKRVRAAPGPDALERRRCSRSRRSPAPRARSATGSSPAGWRGR